MADHIYLLHPKIKIYAIRTFTARPVHLLVVYYEHCSYYLQYLNTMFLDGCTFETFYDHKNVLCNVLLPKWCERTFLIYFLCRRAGKSF